MPVSWNKDEEKQLIKELKDKKTYDEISKIHNRSVSASIMRLNKIIYDNIEAGKSKNSLAKLIGFPVDKITQSYYEHKAFMEKKDIESKKTDSESKKTENNSNNSRDSKISKISKDELKADDSNINSNDKYKKLMKKMIVLQKENQIMKELIENLKLKKSLGKEINNETIMKDVMKIIKKYIN